ncbi:MAG TPA: hypothetical protein VF916_15875 [Ktedonobacterales bacterium]
MPCLACLFALLLVSSPRLAFLFMWIFTPLVERAFNTFVGPLLGLAFLPFTSIMYVLLWRPGVGVVGWAWLWVVLAFLVDMAAYAGSLVSNRQQIEGYPGTTYPATTD